MGGERRLRRRFKKRRLRTEEGNLKLSGHTGPLLFPDSPLSCLFVSTSRFLLVSSLPVCLHLFF
jgi:hypothetical protein